MKITAYLDRASLNNLNKELDKWKKAVNKDTRDGIILLSKAASKSLIQKTRPIGLSAGVGRKFEGSIARQVFKGILRQTTKEPRQAHKQSRNAKGQVPGRLYIVKGHTKFDSEAENVVKRKKAFAGMLKAAWGVAFNKVKGSTKITGIGRWISRHFNKNSIGSSYVVSGKSKFIVSLTNEMDGATNENVLVKQALKNAFKSTFKQIEKIINGKKTTI